MKLLIVNYEYPPIGGGGGKASHNLALSLVQMGHEVDVLTSRYKNYPIPDIPNDLKLYRVKSWRKSIHDCGMIGAFSFVIFGIPTFLKLIRTNRYDSIHYFFSLPTGFLSLFTRRIHNRTTIISLRGSDVPGYDIHNKALQIFHFFLKPITNLIWNRADHVVAVAKSLRIEALKTNRKKNIEFIPNGVEDGFFIEKSYLADKSKFTMITVTRLIKRKGVENLLYALSLINTDNIKLKIVGEGNYEVELKILCTELKLNSVVEFLGFIPSVEIPELLSKADVFILTSLAEAFGNVFAEAMSVGLPIIGSAVGGIEELVSAENGILINPDKNIVESIAAAINEMKNNPIMRMHMGKRNALKMRNHYRWETVAKSYTNLYART